VGQSEGNRAVASFSVSGGSAISPLPPSLGRATPYVTLLGGKENNDVGTIHVDRAGNTVAIAGGSSGSDIPLRGGPASLRSTKRAYDSPIIIRLDRSGRETFAFALPWANSAMAAFERDGTIVAAGSFGSSNLQSFPRIGPQLVRDGGLWLLTLSADGSHIKRSTMLGAPLTDDSGTTFATDIAVDSHGGVILVGTTSSAHFPTANGLTVYPPHKECSPATSQINDLCVDSYVLRVAPGWAKLAYSTFYGGEETTEATAVAVSDEGDAVVVGYTDASSLPTLHAAQPRLGGNGASPLSDTSVPSATSYPRGTTSTFTPSIRSTNAFAAKFDSNGKLLYATYLGGHKDDQAASVALDEAGDAFVAGYKTSADFPITHQLRDDASLTTSTSGFVTEISPDGRRFLTSTTIGGESNAQIQQVSVAPDGEVGFGGISSSGDLPTTLNAAEPSLVADADYQNLSRGFAGSFMPGAKTYTYLSYIGHGGIVRILGAGFDEAGLLHVVGTQHTHGASSQVQHSWLLGQTSNTTGASARNTTSSNGGEMRVPLTLIARDLVMGKLRSWPATPPRGASGPSGIAVLFAVIDTHAPSPSGRMPLEVMGLRHEYAGTHEISISVQTASEAHVSANIKAMEDSGTTETVNTVANRSGGASLTFEHIPTPKGTAISYVVTVTATAHGNTATRSHIYISTPP